MRGLHQQLGVEREVERVAQERDLEQHPARERAVARVELGEIGAHQPVLGRRQPAVGHALPPRHAAVDRPAGLEEARAEHDVGLPAHDRLDEPRDDPRLVLAVGVQHHDHVGVALQRLEVARLLVAAVADVVGMPDEVQRQLARELDRVVGRGVVDEDDLVDPAARDPGHRRLERPGGVAGGHHDDDLGVALAGRRLGEGLVGLEHWTRQRILPPLMATAVPPEIFKAYDIRGLYGEQIDGDVAEAVGRAFARVLADLAGQADGRAARRPRARHAPDRARARRPLPRRAGRRGRARARRRDGRHGDALLPRRLARPRRRPDVHRLAQPEGLHGREAGRARRGRAVGRRRASATSGACSRPASRKRRAAAAPRTSTSTPSSRTPR